MKVKLKERKGITLIALVITIIVLLILAGITIGSLTKDNGIIKQANLAKLETRGSQVEEEKEIWEIQKADNEEGTMSVEKFVESLVDEKLLTEDERDTILGNSSKGIEATGKVTIGSREIVFFEKSNEYEYYMLTSGIIDGHFGLKIFNEDTYFANKYIEDLKKINEMTDEEIFIQFITPLYNFDKNYGNFEEMIDDFYNKGLINKKYDNLDDLLLAPETELPQEEYEYIKNKIKTIRTEGVDINPNEVEVIITNPEGRESNYIEVPKQRGKYTFTATVTDNKYGMKKYNFEISIDKYELVLQSDLYDIRSRSTMAYFEYLTAYNGESQKIMSIDSAKSIRNGSEYQEEILQSEYGGDYIFLENKNPYKFIIDSQGIAISGYGASSR